MAWDPMAGTHVQKEMDVLKPRRNLVTLDDLVDDFIFRRPDDWDQCIERCRHAGSLREAIWAAAEARGLDGKCHNHQSKIPWETKREWGAALQSVRIQMLNAKTFDDLFDVIDAQKFKGIGDVCVYDTTDRIAAYLRLTPQSTYLHAGVRLGASILGLPVKGVGRLSDRDMPQPMLCLTPGQREDFLCGWRGLFGKLGIHVSKPYTIGRCKLRRHLPAHQYA